MRIRSRKNTPDLRALKAADGKQARPSPPPGQMVKWYNMLSKKPQRILSVAVMVLIVLSALVCPWLMSKIRAKPHCWWLISELCKCVCVCVCVCVRERERFWLSTSNYCWSRNWLHQWTKEREGQRNRLHSDPQERNHKWWILWEISLILKWNIPEISFFLSLCMP